MNGDEERTETRAATIMRSGDLQLVGTLGGIEMGRRSAGIPHKPGGVQAAIDCLAGNA